MAARALKRRLSASDTSMDHGHARPPARAGTDGVDAVPQRGGDARGVHPQGAGRASIASASSAEVVIADNGSTDGSQDIAEREGARVVPVARAGIRRGAVRRRARPRRAATSSWATPTTATTSARLDAFVERLRDGADLVMGNRFLGGIEPRRHAVEEPLHRQPGAVRRSAGSSSSCPVGDFHCGLRGFSREAFAAHGAADHGHGIRVGDGDQGDAAAHADRRSADDARQGRTRSTAAPAAVARRLASPALHAALQPALAVPVSRACC